MIKHVKIVNFQSIKEAELDFGRVNVILGPGNQGKSAIMRAISAVLFNATGDEFIREGAKSCTVEIQFDDHTIEWKKERGKSGIYTLDGQLFTKTKGAVPEPVVEALGIRELEIDQHSSLTPQVQGQFDAPFIVGETGSRISRILGKLTKLDVIVTAQMKCKNALQGHKRAADTAAEEAERLLARLNSMPDVETMRAKANELAEKMHSAEQMADILASAQRAAGQLVTAQRAFNPTKLLKDRALVKNGLVLLESRAGAAHRYQIAARDLATAVENTARCQHDTAVAHAEHEAAVKEAGLCPTCPFR